MPQGQSKFLDISEVSLWLGGAPVLRGVDLTLTPGETCGLIGPSGSGKSVLLKTIAGVLQQSAGTIRLDTTADQVSLMFQEGALFDSMTVFENVAFPFTRQYSSFQSLPRDQRLAVAEQVSQVLAAVGLSKAAAKYPAQISGGMRRRASLARAIVTKPQFLMLDDPTSGLDPVASSIVMKLIRDLSQEFKPTMIIVSHDLRRLLPLVDTVAFMDHGRISMRGAPRDVFTGEERIASFVRCRFSEAEFTQR